MSFIERLQRTTGKKPLVLLEMSAPSFADTLYLANDTRAWKVDVGGGPQEFIAMPFRLKLPEDIAGSAASIQIQVDNVGREMTQDLENMPPNQTILARIILTGREDPNAIFRTFVMPITKVSINARSATATGGMDSILRMQAVRKRANNFTLPGGF